MSDFMKWLYAHYIKPQIDASPRGEYAEALSGAGAAGPGVEAPAGVPAVEEDGVSRDISAAG